jgi:hypothetical protein
MGALSVAWKVNGLALKIIYFCRTNAGRRSEDCPAGHDGYFAGGVAVGLCEF